MKDEGWMQKALELARQGVGHTSPNPAVGAIVVKGEAIIGEGYHREAGRPHAEIEALRSLPSADDAREATLYVTLEPCSTWGRTPPCVEAIIEAGLRRVVIGAMDPNPRHAGRAIDLLSERGIQVTAGVLEQECSRLNEAFNKWIVTKTPFVIAKAAMTLDGRITRAPHQSQWITSEQARQHSHELRAQVDAILVGAETVRKDNPKLTVRGVRTARQPWRVVLTRSGQLPRDAHLFTDEFSSKTLVFQDQPIEAVLDDLGDRELTSVLIEGGGEVLGEAFDRRIVDRIHFYYAPMITGGGKPAIAGLGAATNEEAALIEEIEYQKLGDEIFATGLVRYPELPDET